MHVQQLFVVECIVPFGPSVLRAPKAESCCCFASAGCPQVVNVVCDARDGARHLPAVPCVDRSLRKHSTQPPAAQADDSLQCNGINWLARFKNLDAYLRCDSFRP